MAGGIKLQIFTSKSVEISSYLVVEFFENKAEEVWIMSLLAFFRNHSHYWGVPHARTSDNRLIQVCYECGAERIVKIELRPSAFADRADESQKDNLAA